MEEKIFFKSDEYRIEGLISKIKSNKGIIITHPHPLYGGEMYNPVVETIVKAYKNKGYTTLRFNFRGAGRSQGKFDNGIGEQVDLISAIKYLKTTGVNEIDLAGYSFGSWVNANANINDLAISQMIMVSPPVEFMDFKPVNSISTLKLVITGSHDDIAPVNSIKKLLPKWNPKANLKIIRGADHFYGRYLDELESVLM